MTDAPGGSAVPAPMVMVVGDVMVDVLVQVRSAVAHASDTPSSILTSPGGSAANQAVWLSRAGALVALVACAGLDPFGDAAIAALETEGVDVSFIARVGRPTGTVVALVEPDGQRSMLTDRAANLELGATEVVAALSAPETLGGRQGPVESLRSLASSFGEVVLTLGAEGAIAVDTLGSVHRAAATSSTVADTVGAGDALCATYLARRLLGANVTAALQAAVEVSASAVGSRGARDWSDRYSRE